MQNIFFFLAIIVLIACNNTKKVTESKAQHQATENTLLPDSMYRFTVSFISIGSGTDKKAAQQFSQFIEQFNSKKNTQINSEITRWGKEGEIDYCLKLTELSKQQQDKFISETKELLATSKLIRYYENTICPHSQK